MGGRGEKGGARRSPKMWPVSWTQTFVKCGGLFLQVDWIQGVHVSEWRGGGKKALGPTVVESAQCAEHTHILSLSGCALWQPCVAAMLTDSWSNSRSASIVAFFLEIFTQASKRAMFILSMRGTTQSHCELPRYFDASRHMFLSAPTDNPPRSSTPRMQDIKKVKFLFSVPAGGLHDAGGFHHW